MVLLAPVNRSKTSEPRALSTTRQRVMPCARRACTTRDDRQHGRSGARALLVGVATATAAAMVATGGLPAVAADAPTTWKFDLGTATSPVADGYQQVTDATRYSAATGFGIVPADGVTPISRDRGAEDPADRDFVLATAWTFVARRAQRHLRRDGPLGRPARREQHHQDHGDPRGCGRRLAEHQGGHRLRHLAGDGRRRAAHRRDHRQRCGRLRELDRRRADGDRPRGAGARAPRRSPRRRRSAWPT